MGDQRVAITGAGLVGSLLAILLGNHGVQVDVFERRPDMRKKQTAAGRSINLAVSRRALHALKQVNMEDTILQQAVPMRGRMIHLKTGDVVFQSYSDGKIEYLYSISRGDLNKELLNAAEKIRHVGIFFNQKALGMNFEKGILHLRDEEKAYTYDSQTKTVLGCDGSRSAIRQAMDQLHGHTSIEEFHSHGYKELTIPAGPDSSFLMEKNSLHLWPRGTYMLLATPNCDGSFTCTLFLPLEGQVSFEQLTTPHAVDHFFQQQFPDVAPLLQDLSDTFLANPIGTMSTIKAYPWHVNEKALLLGDAAHAIVPFFGQGMNCGFEDCTALFECISHHQNASDTINWSNVFPDFVNRRKVNTDAIADMAAENFTEIHNKVTRPKFLLEKTVEGILESTFPRKYFSRYSLIAFSLIPYSVVREIGIINNEILFELCKGLTNVIQLDLKHAKKLIHTKLTPILTRYTKELLLD